MKRMCTGFALALGLSACTLSDTASSDPQDRDQTSQSATVTPGDSALPNYEPLIGSTSSGLSQLQGSVVTARTGQAQVRRVTGRIRHSGGKLVIDDGIYKLADDNGFDRNGEAENEGVVLRLVNPDGKYRYASLYSTSYVVDGDTYTAVGAIGIGTRTEDMPNRGLATYSGDAVYAYTTQTGNGFAGFGTFNADVDFEGNQMAAYVEVGTAQNPFTRADIADPAFDRIDMDRFTISGTGFSGNDMRTSRNGSQVQVTGNNPTAQVEGQFYGLARRADGSLIPDEIAGEALLEGDTGNVILSFIAD